MRISDWSSDVCSSDLLAILDTSRLDDAVIRARAGLSAAQAQVVQARASRAESQAALSRLREVSRLSGGKVPAKTEMEAAVAAEARARAKVDSARSEEHTSELQSLMRNSYAVFFFKKINIQ